MATASDIRPGVSLIVNGEPYRVTRKEVIAVGTHSHTKLKVFARPLFGGAEKPFILAHNDKVELADIIKKSGQIISMHDRSIQLMDSKSYETFDAELEPGQQGGMGIGDEIIFIDYQNRIRVVEKIRKSAS